MMKGMLGLQRRYCASVVVFLALGLACLLCVVAGSGNERRLPDFGVEFAYSVEVRMPSDPKVSFSSFTSVSAKQQKMKTLTVQAGSGDRLWDVQVYDCMAKRAYRWIAFINNTLGPCNVVDISPICPIATGPTFWGSFQFVRNVSLLEYDEVQHWLWQGPYSWQKGDFYTRIIEGRYYVPVAIAAMAASPAEEASSVTWNYYTSFSADLPREPFQIPHSCSSSSPSLLFTPGQGKAWSPPGIHTLP